MNHVHKLFLCLTATMLIACNLQNPQTEDSITVTVEPELTADLESRQDETQAGAQEVAISVWAPSFFARPEDGPGADATTSAYMAFTEANEGVELIIQPKAESGGSALQSYMRAASQVAPAVLPDVILVEMQKFWPLVEEFEIQPLSNEEISFHLDDAYPFAQDAVQFNQQTYGIPYAASIIHMVYARQEFQDESGEIKIPTSWSELLSAETTYLFPAAGQSRLSSDMLLLQYVGAGGQLTADGSVVNTEALTALFNFMASGVESGLFPAENQEISADKAIWELFVSNPTGLVNVRSEQYLSQREAIANLDYAAVPTRSGLAATIGRVWAFVVVTDEPSRRALALDLVSRLREPQVHGTWSQNARLLPTHMESLNSWVDNQPYYDFLRQQMDIALALPNGESFANLSRQIQSAQFSVLDAQLSATDAVNQVLNQE